MKLQRTTRDEPPLKETLKSLAVKAGVAAVTAVADPLVGAVVAVAPAVVKAIQAVVRNFDRGPTNPREAAGALMMADCIVRGTYRRLQAGELPRADDFFDPGINRSKAEDVCAAVLRACTQQDEEKKIPHVAKIYEYAVFTTVSKATVISLVKHSSDMTWRHFYLLGLLARPDTGSVVARFYAIPGADLDATTDAPLIREDLERLTGRANSMLFDDGGRIGLTNSGRLLVKFAELDAINDDELDTDLAVMRAALAARDVINARPDQTAG